MVIRVIMDLVVGWPYPLSVAPRVVGRPLPECVVASSRVGAISESEPLGGSPALLGPIVREVYVAVGLPRLFGPR